MCAAMTPSQHYYRSKQNELPKPMALSLPPTIMEQTEEVSTPLGSVQCWRHHLRRRDRIRAQPFSTLLNGDPMKLHEAMGLELERREMEITFEFACAMTAWARWCRAICEWFAERDRLRERNEALEKAARDVVERHKGYSRETMSIMDRKI